MGEIAVQQDLQDGMVVESKEPGGGGTMMGVVRASCLFERAACLHTLISVHQSRFIHCSQDVCHDLLETS